MSTEMVFVFIFVIIVMGFLLTVGMGLITDFFGISESAQITSQIKSLQNLVCSGHEDGKCQGGLIWAIPGETRVFEFRFPGSLEKACFFNHSNPAPNPANGWFGDKAIETVIKSRERAVELFKKDGSAEGFSIPKLFAGENFCIKETSDLLLTAKGSWVDIEAI